MPLMYHFEIPEELDKKLKQYMLDHDIAKKSNAIIQIIRNL